MLTSKLIDGTFPDYNRVIPTANDKLLKLDPKSFAQGVDRVSTIASEKTRAVKMNVDRDKVNRAVFQALKSGGTYAIIDHSGRRGTGATEVKTLHRIEEKLVRAEIEKATVSSSGA